jgi:hypothetical protein
VCVCVCCRAAGWQLSRKFPLRVRCVESIRYSVRSEAEARDEAEDEDGDVIATQSRSAVGRDEEGWHQDEWSVMTLVVLISSSADMQGGAMELDRGSGAVTASGTGGLEQPGDMMVCLCGCFLACIGASCPGNDDSATLPAGVGGVRCGGTTVGVPLLGCPPLAAAAAGQPPHPGDRALARGADAACVRQRPPRRAPRRSVHPLRSGDRGERRFRHLCGLFRLRFTYVTYVLVQKY